MAMQLYIETLTARLRCFRARQATIRALHALDDHQPEDIGLPREAANSEVDALLASRGS